ncbi:MAG: DNA-processing protein DprA [Deltaproteobacteria bacterium]|nr:DNA-processing protein DprA [Deltaproteobacteria bacterium]MBI3390091.1 DNA-processing protein DprA [Deltaproteobacteria bacterium]
MDSEAALAAVMLSQLPRVGEKALMRVLHHNAVRGIALADFFRLPEAPLRDAYALPAAAVRRICEERDDLRREAQELLGQMAGGGVAVWLPDDAAYPARWRERADPCPPVVFALGAGAAFALPALAILNSRGLSERAVTAIIRIGQSAAAQGLAIVSGGMKATHRIPAVLGRAAPARVIVLERGLFAAFGRHLDRDPFGLGPGRAALDAVRTLVLSPFRLRDHAVARNGPRRDELVAALADIIVAVSTRPGGQIERICFAALDRGQCVLSWLGENAGLVAAGAVPIDEGQLNDLRRFVVPRR